MVDSVDSPLSARTLIAAYFVDHPPSGGVGGGAVDSRARVFIVEDHPIVRQGLAALIQQEADLTVCGDASDVSGARERIAELLPDLVIVDLSLGRENGIQLIRHLRAKFEGLPVLVVTMHDEMRNVRMAVRSGASGFLTKQEAAENVLDAIRSLLDGRPYFSERITPRIVERQFARGRVPVDDPEEALTPRELEVFRLVGQGSGTRQIALDLDISAKTVETHYAHIKNKLDLRDATQMAQFAIRWVLGRRG